MEQTLIEDLVIESIRIYGIDTWYIIRDRQNHDDILNEDDLPVFTEAYQAEMYVKNVDGFEGEGDFLSKFGLQIRDSMTMTLAIRVFDQEIGFNTTLTRPREGDLLYFPLNNKMFEIMHVEHEAIFYQMGSLQTYDLRCELFEFSNERFETGVLEIDTLFGDYDTTSAETIEDLERVDPLADNFSQQTFADSIIDFSEKNPFGEDQF